MHVHTNGEPLEWFKVTISNIWGADLNGQWQRRRPGSVARGVVTCGTQRGEQTSQFLSVILRLRETLGYG